MTILYVNGDSHAAAAEAAGPHAWAQDDSLYWGLGQQPHPDNERVSFGCELANWLRAILYLDAQAGGSNSRIMRTTRDWVKQNKQQISDTFVLIQWSTWERQEWWHDGTWWQVNASGTDHVPEQLQDRYRQFVVDIDWTQCSQQAHDDIWQFHCELEQQGVRHLMFNGNSHFGNITQQQDWKNMYMSPYSSDQTYDSVLRRQGFQTVSANSWHFGQDAHCFWAEHVLQYIKDHQLLSPDEIPSY